MKGGALVLVVGLGASTALAQEAEVEGSSGLAGLLERGLSNETMQVRVEGLTGALSAAAQIERLSFADADGVWLLIEGAVLDWNRTALLRGRVDVNRLEAEKITLTRTPVSSETQELPEAKARSEPFSLPELPVSIAIDTISAPEIVLGDALLGEEIIASLEGGLQLAGGDALVDLDLRRTDVEGTSLTLGAGFSNETSVLDIDLEMIARPGGLVVRRLNLPDAPGLDLTVEGSGPLTDFEAQVALRSDSAIRLGGTVALNQTEAGPVRLTADIAGDIRPLLAPDLGAFFGEETAVRLAAVSNEDGSRDLERLHITTEAFDVAGKGRLSANGWPEKLALTGIMERADGTRVRLPVAGPALTLDSARLGLHFDALQGAVWSAVIAATGLEQDQIRIGTADLRGAGTVDLPQDATRGGLEGQLLFAVDGIDLGNPDLTKATGEEIRLSTGFTWAQEDNLEVSDLRLDAGGAVMEFDGTLGQIEDNLPVEGQLSADLPDLSRFAEISGLPLTGALELDANGAATLRTGAFDVTLTGSGRELRTGIEPVDQLLVGRADVALSAARTSDGIELREVSAVTPAVQLTASGSGTGAETTLEADLRLDNLARLVPEFPGPVTVAADVTQIDDNYGISLDGEGPAGTAISGEGTVARDFSSVDLALTSNAQLALLNPVLNPLTASGAIAADLQVSGPPALSSVSGTVGLSDARIAEPTVGLAVQAINGQVALSGASAQIDITGQGNRGGTLSIGGGVGLNAPISTDLSIVMDAFAIEVPGTLTTTVSADLGLNGALPNAAVLGGTITLGETEIRIPDGGAPDAITEGITHVSDRSGVRRTRERAGLGPEDEVPAPPGGAAGGLGLDLSILARNKVFIRGYGLDAELSGELEVGGTTGDPRPVGEIELVRGRIAVLGQRLELDEGRIQLVATLIPELFFAATTSTDEAEVTVVISGPANDPEFAVTSTPPLPEDEALAQLLFGRSLNELSGFQTLQLANSLVALRNGTGLGFVNQLRESTGLDDLDLDSDDEGNANLRVGKYLTEDIYTNVDVKSSGETGVSINIDLTNSLTARGTVTSAGNDSLGLFFERDY